MGEKKGKRGSAEEPGIGCPVFQSDDSRLVYRDSRDFHSKTLSEQLAQKTGDLERLREYVTQLEEGEKGLIQELTRQLAIKDEEVSRIAALYAKKEAENRKLSESFEAHVIAERENAEKIKSLLIKKERENSASVESLQREIIAKNSEISALQKSLISKSGNDKDYQKLTEMLESESISGSVHSRLKEQLSFMGEQVESLKGLIDGKELTIKKLEAAFESREAQVESGLKLELEQRKEEIKGLKRMLFEEQRKSPNLSMQLEHDLAIRQIEALNRQVSESNLENKKLQSSFIEEQKLNKSIQERLRHQISSMSLQLEELKSLLIEKERLLQGLENAFEKRIAAKEEELNLVRNEAGKRPEPKLYREFDELKEEIKIKEQSSQSLSEEVANLKEQVGILHKRLEERQRIYSESEKTYEQLINHLREQQQARISAIIKESTQKESALRTTFESERSKMQHQEILMREKEKQIEETITSFTKISEQMFKLGTASLAEGEASSAISTKREELESKEKELKGMLSQTEEKINELKAREAVVESKEQLLFKQQEALNRQLDILNNAGIEIGKSKRLLESKLESIMPESQFKETETQEYELPEFQEVTKPSAMAEKSGNEEGPLPFMADEKKPSKSSSDLAEKIKIMPIKSHLKANVSPVRTEQELFSEMGGYSESEEIRSVVEVGLQHGDTIEQIKESLADSGYSKQNIEKVLNSFRK